MDEIARLPSSVAEAETALPAFIGYTEKATNRDTVDLRLKPTKVLSLVEYERTFGYADSGDHISIEISTVGGRPQVAVIEPKPKHLMYYSLRTFFANGGGGCYIVSVGPYADGISSTALEEGLRQVESVDETTLLVVPEAISLDYAGYQSVVRKMLAQCAQLGDRFAILDLFDGYKNTNEDVAVVPEQSGIPQVPAIRKRLVEANRDAWPNIPSLLRYGAAYYPFLKTTLNFYVDQGETNVDISYGDRRMSLAKCKTANRAIYDSAKTELKKHYVRIPPSPAIAGVYASSDSQRGVWKSPANVKLAGVIEPLVKLDDTGEDDLSIDATEGKSINTIRSFPGKGILVWGARTLAGNDNEWRYISVRRFVTMVEESIKKSTAWAVFEPNDEKTWGRVRSMIENYLILKWRQGAIAGAKSSEAFFVKCGLGTTMTTQDLLEGRLNIELGLAVVRPAEFLVVKLFQRMHPS